jgi:hypothetical protein
MENGFVATGMFRRGVSDETFGGEMSMISM